VAAAVAAAVAVAAEALPSPRGNEDQSKRRGFGELDMESRMHRAGTNSAFGAGARPARSTGWRAVLFVMAIVIFAVAFASALAALKHNRNAASAAKPLLVTNERAIAEALKPTDGLKISDPKAVFSYVLKNLPALVKVYPTENYYYFSFLHGGVAYAGNLRLDASDRDSGKLHFAYFRRQTPWMGASAVTHLLLDRSHGVEVQKIGALAYRVKTPAASVVFELNDLSGLTPPPESLIAGERYLGPVFDESGMRFFLIFNPGAKAFHYVLDETAPLADRLAETSQSRRIHIGMRTGFAFYSDHRAKRKILIGVDAQNEHLNTQFDGPFDQLPDNFIQGESLRQAILEVEPDLQGQIDRLGHFHDNETRYLIGPYVSYESLADLAGVRDCADAQVNNVPAYAACFVTEADAAGL